VSIFSTVYYDEYGGHIGLLDGGWWSMSELLKQERERRYAILITALQDFFNADMRYTSELEAKLNIETKVVEKEVGKGAKKKPSVQ